MLHKVTCFILFLLLVSFSAFAEKKAPCQVDSTGHIVFAKLSEDTVAFRTDLFAGPSIWLNGSKIPGSINADGNGLYGSNDTLSYRISYSDSDDRLAIHVECKNLLKTPLSEQQLSLFVGIDTEMKSYPQWRNIFFPTLMRCEKSHFWGYLMTPEGRIITLSSPDPIASYRLLYNNSKHKISFGNGHRIRTVSLDLLNPSPLPERNPQGQTIAASGTRRWTIYLDEVDALSDVAKSVSQSTQAPILTADYYTLAPKQLSRVLVNSLSKPSIEVVYPDGSRARVKAEFAGAGVYGFDFEMTQIGVHTFRAKAGNRQSEMKLTCRHSNYSDYIKAARQAAVTYQQKTNSNPESWYGLFSAMIAREYFPDGVLDAQLDFIFHQINAKTFDLNTHMPLNNPWRIQDTALKAALWARYYRATGNIEHLRWAADLADFIMTKQISDAADIMVWGGETDGAYRSHNTHYTSVIYIAKGIMEVMNEERKLAAHSEEWRARYNRHYASVKKAMDDLARRLDNIQTEGEQTFEDGMISCSYTQLSEFALLHPEGSSERLYYAQAAEKLADMHRCLSQIVVPDSRINGGSLRFWESQYDILTMPNMLNSPHGWSAWRIYGLRNLYLLTGKYNYLRQMINSIGSCIQLINPQTGDLNWAFVADPYIKAQRFVPDPNNKGKGIHVEQILGEEYLPMISDWYRADTTKFVSSFARYDGGSNDNDVHEIFKCLGEVLLTSAYVYEHEDGRITAHNCRCSKNRDELVITPSEECVEGIHVNLRSECTVKVLFGEITESKIKKNGWIIKLDY